MPIFTQFGSDEGNDSPETHRVTWIDIDIAEAEDLAWLAAWNEISDQTKALLLDPVRFSHRENLAEGMFLSLSQQVLLPITTDPALALDADDRETLVRASNHVTRYMKSLDDCGTRIRMLEDEIQAQRATTMNRSSLNLTIVATVFLPLTFVSGLLGMNVAGIPDQHEPWAFWVVTVSLIIGALLAWWVLRRRMRD